MKIVCISASQVPSDSANSIQVMKVCQALAQLGHEILLIIPAGSALAFDDRQLLDHYGLNTAFPVEHLPARSRRTFPRTAVKRANDLGVNLVYAWPVQAAVLGLLSGFPVLLEMHDVPSGFFGPLWYRLFLGLPGKKRLLPITAALQRALKSRYGPPRRGDTLIAPDGVDLERYADLPEAEAARLQLGLNPGQTVGCTGHLYPGRGADLFLALAAALPQVNFVWVGGRPADAEAWQARAQDAALHNVTFTGFVPNRRLPLYQAAADILLMPYGRSITTSSGGNTAEICSPMKMFEYMAASRPILASDLPVFREVLDESCAVLCPPDDPQAWKSALVKLLEEPELRQQLAQAARTRVTRFTWTERARRCLNGFEA
jgi:glycosyltransferase involved in cell wall biosynthesis